jgi:hypothetical protein
VLALDSFNSTIPGFKGDDLILANPISARAPNTKSTDDSLANPSVGSSSTLVGKRKDIAALSPLKKLKKVVGKKTRGVKINDHVPKPSSTPTPPKGTWGKFNMRRSNKYS